MLKWPAVGGDDDPLGSGSQVRVSQWNRTASIEERMHRSIPGDAAKLSITTLVDCSNDPLVMPSDCCDGFCPWQRGYHHTWLAAALAKDAGTLRVNYLNGRTGIDDRGGQHTTGNPAANGRPRPSIPFEHFTAARLPCDYSPCGIAICS
jgi:hypothetical protein